MTAHPHTIVSPILVERQVGKSWSSIGSFDKAWLLLDRYEIEMLGDCKFMPRRSVMEHIKCGNWTPELGIVSLYVLQEDISKERPKSKKVYLYTVPDKMDSLFVKLANLSDTHGIVSMYCGTIWLAQMHDPKNLNIDGEVMDEIEKVLNDGTVMEKAKDLRRQLSIVKNSLYGIGGAPK